MFPILPPQLSEHTSSITQNVKRKNTFSWKDGHSDDHLMNRSHQRCLLLKLKWEYVFKHQP